MSNAGQKDNLEAMQSTKLNTKNLQFFQLTSDHFKTYKLGVILVASIISLIIIASYKDNVVIRNEQNKATMHLLILNE